MNVEKMQNLISVRHGFFGAEGGVSTGAYTSLNVAQSVGDDVPAVFENRKKALATIGLTNANLVFAGPLAHGNKVWVVRNTSQLDVADYDAIVSDVSGVAIGLSVADCVPLFMYDSAHNAVAVVHAGWRGLVAGVIGSTIEVMQKEYGTSIATLRAAVGPCICVDHYEIGEEITADLPEECLVRRNDHIYLNLRKMAFRQLEHAGVINIASDNRCNFEDPSLYSYRRDKITGRQLAVIAAN